MTIEIRALTENEEEPAHRLRSQAFGVKHEPLDPDRPRRDPDRDPLLGAWDGARLVAAGHAGAVGQWFGGCSVPMGAVGGVATVPDARGSGAGRLLMAALVDEMRQRGLAVSTLYPATTAFYRALGWEVAGTRRDRVAPARTLSAVTPLEAVGVRPARSDELDAIRAVYDAAAPTHTGWMDRDDRYWELRRWRHERDDGPHRLVYVAERDDDVVGYVTYHHTEDDPRFYGLSVTDLVAPDADVLTALLRLLGSNRSVTDRVTFRGVDERALLLTLPQQDLAPTGDEWAWMLRVLDAPAALAVRGYPPSVSARVEIEIHDEHVGDHAGRWVLEVDDGAGRLSRGGAGRVETDIGALSSLYTGWASPWDLARTGRLAATDPRDLAALTAVFAGPDPWLPDFF